MDKKSKKAARKKFGRCGFLAFIMFLFMGTLFGLLAAGAAYTVKYFFPDIYMILMYPIIMSIVLGLGMYLAARIGRCSKFSWLAFFLVTLFSVFCYGSFLFLNDYHKTLPEESATIMDEAILLAEDGQNFLAELPWVSDYIKPVGEAQTNDAAPAGDEQADDAASVEGTKRPNLGTRVLDFLITRVPAQATQTDKPVIVGTLFDMMPLTYLKPYLLYPGITRWETEEEKTLVFDERYVKPWMLWAVEWIVLWTITLIATKRATTRAFDAFQVRMKKRGGWQPGQGQGGLNISPQVAAEEKSKKEKRSLFGFGKKKKKAEPKEPESTADQDLSESDAFEVEETVSESSTDLESEPEEKKKKKKKKRSLFGFGKKKKQAEEADEPDEEESGETGAVSAGQEAADVEFDLPPEPQEQRYALILHQYNEERRDDLLLLIQQIGQISEERAKRLLRPPSLLKQDATTQDAQLAIEKFKQIGATVKLITMQQLLELQKKQQKSAPPAQKPAASSSGAASGERYALILRKFDSSQRKQVLELLASVSKTPVEQLQQTLKTPALVLRDASRDEAAMLAKQFESISAEVKMLTMTDLKKLMAKK